MYFIYTRFIVNHSYLASGISACLCSRYTLFHPKACVRGIFPLPQSCSLFATHTFPSKNLCRGRDEPQNNRFLFAIQGNPAKRVCRRKGNRENRDLLFAIHTFRGKSLCRGGESRQSLCRGRDEAQNGSKITDGWRRRGSSAPPGGRTAPGGSAGRRRCGLRSGRCRSGRAISNRFP